MVYFVAKVVPFMARGGPVLMAKGGILPVAEIGILYLTIYICLIHINITSYFYGKVQKFIQDSNLYRGE